MNAKSENCRKNKKREIYAWILDSGEIKGRACNKSPSTAMR